MVELPPKVMVGLLVELMAAPAAPENPTVFAVLNVPFIVKIPGVAFEAIEVVPAFKVDPEATVVASETPRVTAKLFVFSKLPELTFPTVMVPVIFVAVTAAPKVAPDTFILFTSMLLKLYSLTFIVCAELLPLKFTLPVLGVNIPVLVVMKVPLTLTIPLLVKVKPVVPEPTVTSPLKVIFPLTVSVPVEIVTSVRLLLLLALPEAKLMARVAHETLPALTASIVGSVLLVAVVPFNVIALVTVKEFEPLTVIVRVAVKLADEVVKLAHTAATLTVIVV